MPLVRRHVGCLLIGILQILLLLSHSQRFNCETATCAKHDVWTNVSFPNSTEVCEQLQINALSDFLDEFPRQCREFAAAGLGPWSDCRRRYCQSLADLAGNLSHMGQNLHYGDDECRPLVNFKQTLCETSYRDAEAFCECLCPTMGRLQIPTVGGCERKILEFLFLGRRGYELSLKYQLSGYCAGFICEHFTILGDPNPAYPVAGIPPTCKKLDLPWRLYNCNELFSRKPYDPLPWETPFPEDSVLECTDGSRHQVDIREVDKWAVCGDHKFRWRCPQDYPFMCRDPYGCLGDHCCRETLGECPAGERISSIMLSLELPEWVGFLPPELVALMVTTTTMDPEQAFLLNLRTTSAGPSFAQQIGDYAWAGSAVLVVIGLTMSCLACYYMGMINAGYMRKVVIGPARLLNAYHADPVTFFASGNLPRNKKREAPLPPMRPAHEIEEERRDNDAISSLADAWDLATLKGMRHLVSKVDDPDPIQARLLKDAIRIATSRGLQARVDLVEDLVQKGEKWLSTLEAEKDLLRAVEDARPDLRWAAQVRLTNPPVLGKPWHATTQSRAAETEVRKAGWRHIEDLRAAVQAAKSQDISESHMKQAEELLTALVARTHELPADRCVLDPDGEGVKLLPKGQHRAVWPITGDSYTFNEGSKVGGEMGMDTSVPKDILGDAATDDARPVCAEWAKSSTCKAGRDCPWRHCKPQAGDSIRECILFDM